ncbi:MAG TPA: cupin domain-containing protein [Acidimicrobiales bacterium]|nr:cupin domain-containing protein [Acidimicrobiales bacterium]
MTLLASAQISPENHPYSETLIVISGELSCMIDDLVPAVIGAGNAIHIGANRCHNIINPTTGPAEVAMLIGA